MELFSIQSLLLSLLFTFLYFLTRQTKSKLKKKGIKIYPLVGVLPDFIKNRHRFLDWTTQVLRECPTNTDMIVRPGKMRGIITANPENIEHMLKTNFHNYPRGQRFISRLEDFLGNGIFNSDGELWTVQRKTASYEFNTYSIRYFVWEIVTVEVQTRLLPILSREASSESTRVVDLQDILERFAFDNICKLAFNVDPGCLGSDGTAGADFMRAFADASNLSFERFLYAVPFFWKVKKFFNLGSERRLRESILTVHHFADEIIRTRMESQSTNGEEPEFQDLLSRFIGEIQKSSSSHEFLRDIIISFILAGRDSSSSALTWFFWILSSRPDVKQKIRDELRTIRARNRKCISETFTFEELREMNYLHAAISESMRLFPPVPIDSKTCLKDDILPDGTVIKKNWFIMYHTYAMGRMESIWGKDCMEYKPERWIENGVYRAESSFKFPVFHGGPRICLGKDLAYIQMKYIAASLIERFEINVQNGDTCPQHILSLTLRMKGGLPILVKERNV
ncbi:hypothetical protein L6164_016911 [Bauhinia variegata]|uniref:Uncharacterized protein n=1 Tax=Bauhinia variegata TaxID=167791 RepID=A0ACB9N7T3_BAUVA|nr:hypothetical protein L6164_016911 [Bauhinia variegata]